MTSELSPSPHRASFARFLQRDVAPSERADVGLQGALRDAFPVTTTDGLVTLEFVEYMLEPPKYDAAECLRCGMTFAAPIKVVVRLVVWEGDGDERLIRDIKEQEVYFGEVPLLTGDDVFVVAGVERTPLLALRQEASASGLTSLRVRAAGDHLAEAAREGLEAILTATLTRMDKAAAMGSVDTLMPHDILNAKALPRAFLKLLEKSPRVAPLDATNAVARVAHGWTVALDEEARDALEASPLARWLTPSDEREGLAALSPDAPLREDGSLDADATGGDTRSLAARLAGGDGEALARALPLAEAGAPLEGPLARSVAACGGALVLADRAGTAQRVSDRRVWVLEDGATEPRCHALAPSPAPRVVTALALRPAVAEGARVEAGAALAATAAGLALGRRCAAAWRGDLAPGTCRVSTAGARALRSLHRERVDVWVRDTMYGVQEVVRDVPGADEGALRHLDASGVAALGAVVAPGDVLVGRVTPAAGGMGDDAVRAEARAIVTGVEVFVRRGRERSERHEAIVAAMKDDVRAAREEHLACLAALGADEGDARSRHDEGLYALDRGDDLPPGVVSLLRVELLVERAVAKGDALADGGGGRWVVAEVADDVGAEVELAGEGGGGAVWLMKLRPEAPRAGKKVAKKRAANKAAKG